MNKRMKKIILFLLLLSCSVVAQTRYELLTPSKLDWRGEDILRNGHDGTINFQSGYVLMAEQSITKGEFVIGMNTLFSLDEENGKDLEGLSQHLKSDDFFSVDRFPQAFFAIISVNPTASATNQFDVDGLLTIKGIIKLITFPAVIEISKDQLHVKAEFIIDRTMWNITYQSKNFLNDIKDTAIADEVRIKLDLTFEKK